MDAEFLSRSFGFHQSMFQDLKDRKWDHCDGDMIKDKFDFIFKICYGNEYLENKELDSYTANIRRKFMDISKKEGAERLRKFNCSFTYNKLVDGGAHWISPLFWTISNKGGHDVLIDDNCREYKSVDEFLKCNTYPECFITFPEGGLYKGTNFVKLNCAWSKACSTGSKVKKVADVVTVVAGAAATAAIFANPVGLPLLAAGVGLLSSSAYNIYRRVENLIDVNDHCGGLSITNEDTLINVADIVLSTGCLVTLGASSVMRSIAQQANTVFVEGSAFFKIVTSLEKTFKAFSVSGVTIFLIVFVIKFRNRSLTLSDYTTLAKYILFSLNCYISIDMLKRLVSDFSDFGYANLKNSIMRKSSDCFVFIKDAMKFLSSTDYEDLLNLFFPIRQTPLFKEVARIKDKVTDIASVTHDLVSGTIDPFTFIHRLSICMNNLFEQVVHSMDNKQDKISQLLKSNKWKDVCKWSVANKTANRCNTYERKIEMADRVETNIVETSTLLESEDRERMLFDLILSLITRHDVQDDFEAMMNLNSYCKIFADQMKALTEQYVYDEYTITADAVYAKVSVKKEIENREKFEQRSFEKVINNMIDESESLHKQLMKECKSVLKEETKVGDARRHVYVFNWPLNKDEVNSDVYYEIANSIAKLTVNKTNATFSSYANNMSMLKITKNNSIVVFCNKVMDNSLRGVMIYVPTF